MWAKKEEGKPLFKFEGYEPEPVAELDFTAEEVADEIAPTYIYVKQLGQGSQGRVVLARDTRIGGRPVAIKLIARGGFVANYRSYFAREITHHCSLLHPFVIGTYEAFLTTRFLGLAMEWATGGSLHTLLNNQYNGRFQEETARIFFQQLILGMDYVHKRGVANRDMKLENLLLDSPPITGSSYPYLKICDFGYSKHDSNSHAYTVIGTPNYMAPEVIRGENRYDPFKADIWSAGVILYVMLMGRYPYDKDELGNVIIAPVIYGNWHPFDPSIPLSGAAQELLTRMLETDPGKRITLQEIMNMPWFKHGLPVSSLTMNEIWLDIAPKSTEPPLCFVGDFTNELMRKAGKKGTLGDGSEYVRAEFPCRKLLTTAISEGYFANGPIPSPMLHEIYSQLQTRISGSRSGIAHHGISLALTYNEPFELRGGPSPDDVGNGANESE